jgi:hypothetical protein
MVQEAFLRADTLSQALGGGWSQGQWRERGGLPEQLPRRIKGKVKGTNP